LPLLHGRALGADAHFTLIMSRKPTKGYFVRGQFVALGSELDIELKRELKGSAEMSKTDLKKYSDRLQQLGESLLTLRADLMNKLDLSEKLVDAVAEARRITNFEGRRRQMQYIGKLMRGVDEATLAAVEAALDEQNKGSAKGTLSLHQAEQWRDRLIADDEALTHWLELDASADVQQLRALIRQARKDAQATLAQERPGEAVRHGKAYREIFQTVKAALNQDSDDTPDTPDNENAP
jgi:ribosome-associated protein